MSEVLPRGGGDVEAVMAIWHDFPYPRLMALKGDKLFLKIPYQPDNRRWLREDENGKVYHRRQPVWVGDAEHWELPASWRAEVTKKCIDRYGAAVVISKGKADMEKCARACWNATSDITECTCSCGGQYHGIESNPGDFFEIADALAVKWTPGVTLQAMLITTSGSSVLASVGRGQG